MRERVRFFRKFPGVVLIILGMQKSSLIFLFLEQGKNKKSKAKLFSFWLLTFDF